MADVYRARDDEAGEVLGIAVAAVVDDGDVFHDGVSFLVDVEVGASGPGK